MEKTCKNKVILCYLILHSIPGSQKKTNLTKKCGIHAIGHKSHLYLFQNLQSNTKRLETVQRFTSKWRLSLDLSRLCGLCILWEGFQAGLSITADSSAKTALKFPSLATFLGSFSLQLRSKAQFSPKTSSQTNNNNIIVIIYGIYIAVYPDPQSALEHFVGDFARLLI